MSEKYKVIISYKKPDQLLPNGDDIYECTSTTNSGQNAAIDGALQTLQLLDEDRSLLNISCTLLDS